MRPATSKREPQFHLNSARQTPIVRPTHKRSPASMPSLPSALPPLHTLNESPDKEKRAIINDGTEKMYGEARSHVGMVNPQQLQPQVLLSPNSPLVEESRQLAEQIKDLKRRKTQSAPVSPLAQSQKIDTEFQKAEIEKFKQQRITKSLEGMDAHVSLFLSTLTKELNKRDQSNIRKEVDNLGVTRWLNPTNSRSREQLVALSMDLVKQGINNIVMEHWPNEWYEENKKVLTRRKDAVVYNYMRKGAGLGEPDKLDTQMRELRKIFVKVWTPTCWDKTKFYLGCTYCCCTKKSKF